MCYIWIYRAHNPIISSITEIYFLIMQAVKVGPLRWRVNFVMPVGWAAQIGADIAVTKNCYLNLDVKYYDSGMDATVAGVKYRLALDPIIVGTGIGFRF